VGVRLIGQSSAHRRLLETLCRVAPTEAEILISGPSGVGKELYARYAHGCSRRDGGPFVPVNCGVLPDNLLENELFGHVGGAFTGARPRSDGLVAAAEKGTLFLDEVDALHPASQVKLLRFLQEKEYRRLGDNRIRRADVRVIAATNADLVSAVRNGHFREDLFFRLRVIPVVVPPLRERPEDIGPLLSEHIAHYAQAYQLPPITLTEGAVRRLRQYSWPGNVRELENCVRFLTCLQLGRPVIAHDLPLLDADDGGETQAGSDDAEPSGQSFQKAKRDLVTHFERDYLEAALRRSDGNIAQAARASGKARRAFFELMRKHGLRADDFMSPERVGRDMERSPLRLR
jgi:two-component system, NtrC family, response regulator GlrR